MEAAIRMHRTIFQSAIEMFRRPEAHWFRHREDGYCSAPTIALAHSKMKKLTKHIRRELHAANNAPTRDQAAAIVREQYARARGKRIDEVAKEMIGNAHRLVSPRSQQSRSRMKADP